MLLCGLAVALTRAPDRSGLLLAYLAGGAGLLAINERLRVEFGRTLACLSSLVVFAATSLFFFMVPAPAPRLTAGFAVVAIVGTAVHRLTHGGSWPRLAAGVAVIVITAGAAALVAIGGRSADDRVSWGGALFSASHGFLSLTPVAYIATAATIAYLRRNPAWAASALVSLGLCAWVASGSHAQPWSSTMLPALAPLAPGLAFLIEYARKRPLMAVAPLVVAALLWNYLLMVQYAVGALPKDEPVSFAAMVRQQADVHTRTAYVYPFAFPMNVWFAWREGLPTDRYDLLAAEPLASSLDLALDRTADRFLLDGWDAPGADDAGPSWWMASPRASIALPLALPPERDVAITIISRTRYEEPVVEAELGVEVNGHEVGRFVSAATAPSSATFRLPADVARRTLRAGYNRLTFVNHGVRRVDPADARPPGPIAARAGNRAWPVSIYRIRVEPTL